MLNKPCPNCKRLTYETKCACGYTKVKQFITANDYFMCRTRNRNHPAYGKDFRYVPGYKEEWTPQIQENAENLVKLVNALFTEIEILTGKNITLNITSGWRPSKYSKEIGTSVRSAHVMGQAIDIADLGNKKFNLLEVNLNLLKIKGMAMEHKSATRSWLHLQSVLPRSGNTIFYP
jgi:hypothetical protein